MWILYIALEPYGRPKRGGGDQSWTRLVDGDSRDPLIGRGLVFRPDRARVCVFVTNTLLNVPCSLGFSNWYAARIVPTLVAA